MKTLFVILLVSAALLPIATVEASAAPCVSTVDDLISDGGSTFCVNKDGCLVYESREYIWGRETYCYA